MRNHDLPLPSVVEAIGEAPLVELNRLTRGLPGRIFLKLEYFDPGFSKKDRIARQIIEDADGDDTLGPGQVSGSAAADAPGGAFRADQFNHHGNIRAHYLHTGDVSGGVSRCLWTKLLGRNIHAWSNRRGSLLRRVCHDAVAPGLLGGIQSFVRRMQDFTTGKAAFVCR